MNLEDKKALLDEFKKADGSKRLDIWDYACQQQVIWEKIISEIQKITREQGIDKELDKMAEKEMSETAEKS